MPEVFWRCDGGVFPAFIFNGEEIVVLITGVDCDQQPFAKDGWVEITVPLPEPSLWLMLSVGALVLWALRKFRSV